MNGEYAPAGRRFVRTSVRLPDLSGAEKTATQTQFKLYSSARSVPLEAGVATPGNPLSGLLRELYGLTRLHWVNTRTPIGSTIGLPKAPGPAIPMRPVPSAGARYPAEVYVAAGAGHGVAPALYHYDPAHHALEAVREGDWRGAIAGCLADRTGQVPELFLIISTTFWRTASRYGEFGYRLQCLDTGILMGQALALGASAGLDPVVHLRFDDDAIDAIISLAPHVESTHAIVALGRARGGVSRSAPAWTPEAPSNAESATAQPMLPATRAVHDASRVCAVERADAIAKLRPISALASRSAQSFAISEQPADVSVGWAERRSAGGFQASSLTREQFGQILVAAGNGYLSDLHGTMDGVAHTLLFCASNTVSGFDSGMYFYNAFGRTVNLVRRGDMRAEVRRTIPSLAVAYSIRDAAACFVPAGSYERGFDVYGDRWYRMQNIEAGIMAQRIALAAASLGLGSRINCGYRTERADEMLGACDSSLRTLVQIFVGLPGSATGYEQRITYKDGARR